MENLPVGLRPPSQFAEMGRVLTRKLGVLKAKCQCGQGVVCGQVYQLFILGNGLRLLKNLVKFLENIPFGSQSEDIE
jgi:hypothetical protein